MKKIRVINLSYRTLKLGGVELEPKGTIDLDDNSITDQTRAKIISLASVGVVKAFKMDVPDKKTNIVEDTIENTKNRRGKRK